MFAAPTPAAKTIKYDTERIRIFMPYLFISPLIESSVLYLLLYHEINHPRREMR
jgi:hypothetical protein